MNTSNLHVNRCGSTVIIHGPRGCGKTAKLLQLARDLKYEYLTPIFIVKNLDEVRHLRAIAKELDIDFDAFRYFEIKPFKELALYEANKLTSSERAIMSDPNKTKRICELINDNKNVRLFIDEAWRFDLSDIIYNDDVKTYLTFISD